jgi:hypothetical protein
MYFIQPPPWFPINKCLHCCGRFFDYSIFKFCSIISLCVISEAARGDTVDDNVDELQNYLRRHPPTLPPPIEDPEEEEIMVDFSMPAYAPMEEEGEIDLSAPVGKQ